MGQNPSPQAARRTWLKPPHRRAQLRRSIPTRRSFFARAIALSAPAFLDRSQDARQERSLRSEAHLLAQSSQAGARDHSTLANHSFSLARSRFKLLHSSIARKTRPKNARYARRRIFSLNRPGSGARSLDAREP